jgi:hypothetical protein
LAGFWFSEKVPPEKDARGDTEKIMGGMKYRVGANTLWPFRFMGEEGNPRQHPSQQR